MTSRNGAWQLNSRGFLSSFTKAPSILKFTVVLMIWSANYNSHFIFDATTNQYLMVMPKSKFGINIGIRAYQHFSTSYISKWDVGTL